MLLWLDLETTGLRPDTDRILEVAWTITNDDLSEKQIGVETYVVTPSLAAWHFIEENDFIQKMHGGTGLLDDMTNGPTIELSDVEDLLIGHIEAGVPDNDTIYLAGASVHFDLNFIRFWMPRLAAKLSHRVYDTSTLKAFFGSLGIEHGVENEGQHRAANDVIEVLAVARAYRDRMGYLNNLDELNGMRHS